MNAHVVPVVADRHGVLQARRGDLQTSAVHTDEAVLPARRATLRREAEVHLVDWDVERHIAHDHFEAVL